MSLPLCLLGILPILALPGVVGTARVSEGSSFFARGDFRSGQVVSGVELDPRGDASLSGQRSSVSASYAPRLVIPDLTGEDRDPRLLVFHQAGVGYTYSAENTRYTLGQSFSYGRQYLGLLAVATPLVTNTPQDVTSSRTLLLPTTDGLKIIALASSAAVNHKFSERWGGDVFGFYSRNGGADREARELSPLISAEGGGAGATYSLGAASSIRTGLAVAHYDTSRDQNYWLTTATATWAHSFLPTTTANATVGVTWTQETSAQNGNAGVAPNLAAAVVHSVIRRVYDLNFRAGGQLSPSINTLTGQLRTTLQGTTGIGIRVVETTLAAGFDVGQQYPRDEQSASTWFGTGVSAYQLMTSWLSAYATGRLQWQHVDRASTLTLPLLWSASVGLYATSPTLDF